MSELSPAANAVLDAYMDNCGWLDGPLQKDHQCVAAVLRSAADQLKYKLLDVEVVDCSQLRLLAAELEAQ
jgi:hypothetical protein